MIPPHIYLSSPVFAVVQMLLVFSLDRPPWDGQMATRFLVSAEASDLSVTVLLNKADLVSEETQAYVKNEVPPPKATLLVKHTSKTIFISS
jgi:putative ribosome biogenesis GTPase RsgA